MSSNNRMRFRFLMSAALVCALLAACSGGRLDSGLDLRDSARQVPMVIAHRGYSAIAPENTASAVELAVLAGADLIEIDVQMSADGQLVVMHDTTLSRTTDAPRRYPLRVPWELAGFSSAEIATLDAGSWFGLHKDPGNFAYAGEPVPILATILELLHGRAGLLLEVKSPSLYPGIELAIAEALEQAGWVVDGQPMQRLMVQSFDWDAMATYAALHPQVPVGLLGNPPQDEARWAEVARYADAINPSHSQVDQALVDEIHRRGFAISVYTVNEAARMQALIDMGVDGIITDQPERLRALVHGGAVARGEFSLASADISELSGMARSQRFAGVYWGHNDSGDRARVFAFDGTGRDLGAVTLPGAFAVDWEDMSSFTSDGEAWLLLADVGDNSALRRQVRLHIMREPAAPPYSGSQRDYRSLSVTYPDGPRDCEGVAVDAQESAIYLLSKRDPYPRLYRVPLHAESAVPIEAEFVGEVTSLPLPASGQRAEVGEITEVSPTAFEFSADGRSALIVTLDKSYRYRRAPGQSWLDALNQPPQVIDVPDYPQIEAGTFADRGDAIVIGNEGHPAALYATTN